MRLTNSAFGHVSTAGVVRSTVMCVLVLSLSVSCAALQPLVRGTHRTDEQELQAYENNLIHWNLLSAQYDILEPIPPVSRTDHDGLIAHAAGLNRLFRVAFDFVGDGPAETATGGARDLSNTEEMRHLTGGRIVTIYIGAPEDFPDDSDGVPFVRGILLSEDGWVLTVRHPFENHRCSPDQAYLRVPDHDRAYAIQSCRSGQRSNVILTKFDMDRESVDVGAPPVFSRPRKGETGFVLLDSHVNTFEILDTGIPLQLGSELIYEENFIADAFESMYEATSGTPVWNRHGEIIGLYYHRSADGSTVGFADLTDLPRQIGEAIRSVHRTMTHETR